MPLTDRLELAAQACHAAHLLSCETTCREAIAELSKPTPPALPDEAGKIVSRLRGGPHTGSEWAALADEAASLIERLAPRWISVEDRLQKLGITCLFYVDDGVIEKGMRTTEGWIADDDIDGRPAIGVTHWMPLPPSPRRDLRNTTIDKELDHGIDD